MTPRIVVNVATTEHYIKGQKRLEQALGDQGEQLLYWDILPSKWRSHEEFPYAFKGFALKDAATHFDLLLWCDSCILPVKSLEPLWERIERDGYWMSRNGFSNYEWTADSAYPDLFHEEIMNLAAEDAGKPSIETLRDLNRTIPHVVATAFGLNVKHPAGKAFLDEYYRLASETRAFCGPWINRNQVEAMFMKETARVAPCGPPDVLGHRHDQSCASVIAWRLGFELTSPPEIFAYGKAGDAFDERTILVADGSY